MPIIATMCSTTRRSPMPSTTAAVARTDRSRTRVPRACERRVPDATRRRNALGTLCSLPPRATNVEPLANAFGRRRAARAFRTSAGAQTRPGARVLCVRAENRRPGGLHSTIAAAFWSAAARAVMGPSVKMSRPTCERYEIDSASVARERTELYRGAGRGVPS